MNVLDHFKEKYREPNNSSKVISVENSNIIQVFRRCESRLTRNGVCDSLTCYKAATTVVTKFSSFNFPSIIASADIGSLTFRCRGLLSN